MFLPNEDICARVSMQIQIRFVGSRKDQNKNRSVPSTYWTQISLKKKPFVFEKVKYEIIDLVLNKKKQISHTHQIGSKEIAKFPSFTFVPAKTGDPKKRSRERLACRTEALVCLLRCVKTQLWKKTSIDLVMSMQCDHEILFILCALWNHYPVISPKAHTAERISCFWNTHTKKSVWSLSCDGGWIQSANFRFLKDKKMPAKREGSIAFCCKKTKRIRMCCRGKLLGWVGGLDWDGQMNSFSRSLSFL